MARPGHGSGTPAGARRVRVRVRRCRAILIAWTRGHEWVRPPARSATAHVDGDATYDVRWLNVPDVYVSALWLAAAGPIFVPARLGFANRPEGREKSWPQLRERMVPSIEAARPGADFIDRKGRTIWSASTRTMLAKTAPRPRHGRPARQLSRMRNAPGAALAKSAKSASTASA